ncbi:MAG TPA: Na+/H+ antiporter NhaC family protein [archaeon]|nr:Na+/H+ antiporter NhaC family protein [archaeon]
MNLQNHPVIKDLDKPGGLVIQRRGKNSSPAEEVEFDSSGKAQLSFPEAGHYLVTLRAGDRTSSRLVRVMPGFLTILPPVLAIILALIFRQVLPALFFGIWVGTSLIAGINPWTGLLRLIDTYLVQAMTNKDHVRIIIFSMTLGGMIGLITRCGGAAGLVEWFSRLAVSRRMGQLTTWLIGLLIFFDDYSNTLMVGNTMRPFTDKLKISREKLSFIVDSTAAPVASVALISTWIGFELGLLNTSISSLGLQENAYWLFLKALPYNFYSWACIIFVLMIILTRRDFGPMWRAEKRAIQSGQVLDVNAQPLIDEEMTNLQPPPNTPRRWYNAIVPIGAMSVTLVVGLYKSGLDQVKASGHAISLYNIIGEADPFQVLLWAAFTGVFASFFLILIQRALTVRQSVEAFLIGFKSLTLAMIILTLARIIQLVCTELQTANYLLAISKGLLSPGLLPAITFIIASATSFSTGTSWGTMAILMPLIIPLAYYLPVNAGLPTHSVELTMVATVGAILSGAVFGDHCSPISDTTIMSSMSSGADHIDHVRTQLPYATLVALISVLFGYLPSGMGLLHPVLSIPVILLFLWLALRLLGKKLSG